MEKQLKKVVLPASGFTAHLATSVTYGEQRGIDAVLFSAAKGDVRGGEFNAQFSGDVTLEWTMKKLLTIVKTFTDKDGTESPATREAIDNLPNTDGKLLEVEVDKILDGIKKNA